jgi:hypothetical protein
MASEYVTGLEHSPGAESGPAHAVRRSDADAAPPWTAVCGVAVAHVQGAWTPGEGRAAQPCALCVAGT